MKILFIVQGEGRGHLTQAITLEHLLTEAGHEITGVLVGKSPARQLPAFFRQKIQAPVDTFESPNFLPSSAGNKQPPLLKSIGYNLFRLHKYARSVRFIRRKIKETGADVVVNFYELLTGLTYLFCRPQVRIICIAHQYLFLHPDFKFPEQPNRLELASLKFFTRATAFGANKKLALSFRKMKDCATRRLVVIPPLLRREVLDTKPVKGDYLHGYMVNSGFGEEIKHWHASHKEVPIHFFWDKKEAPAELKIDDTLTFHQLDDTLFLHYMAGAKAYATTAGFESVCEAMYLGKPVLMVPVHIEQRCNAFDALQMGAGAVHPSFDLEILLNLSENHPSATAFREWANQARWLVTREFRPDLLGEEGRTPALRLLTTRWLYKMAHKLI
ncbi:MAG: glycosyltransferase [Parabacteroides sp.]|nr:glycosyltransferase [Parabacteroides sp.]